MNTYSKYKELAVFFNFSFNGVELSHVAACQIWGTANRDRVFTWRHYCKFLFSLNVAALKLPKQNGFLATFMDGRRKDHLDLFNKVTGGLSDSPTVNYLFDIGRKLSFSPQMTFQVMRSVLSQLQDSGISLSCKLHFAIEYVYLCNTIRELDKLDFSTVHKYLCMCHVLGMENLLTQYLRRKGVTTYSLQEGVYYIFKENAVLGHIAYELFETDHLLCWGQYSKDEYVGYGIAPSRIDVAGYPKEKTLKPLKEQNQYKRCLVLLAGVLFGDVNSNLLAMLEGMKEEFSITLKPHPSNYQEMATFAHEHRFDIVPSSETVHDCFCSGGYDFCIVVNSTAYYESWIFGIPCIRYYDERFTVSYGFDDSFTDKSELMYLIEKYRQTPKSQQEVGEMLKYSIGLGLDNYDNILRGRQS